MPDQSNLQPQSQTQHFVTELEERCFRFAKDYGIFCKRIKRNFVVLEYCTQGIRSSASVGANYIEANEAESKNDFKHRVKICRKEAKESRYWLRLIAVHLLDKTHIIECQRLIQEALELMRIFNVMVNKQ